MKNKVQTGGLGRHKRLYDYIKKFSETNEEFLKIMETQKQTDKYSIDSLVSPININNDFPLILIVTGMGNKDKNNLPVRNELRKWLKIPPENIIYIGCSILKALKTICWVKLSKCRESGNFSAIQTNRFITEISELIQLLIKTQKVYFAKLKC